MKKLVISTLFVMQVVLVFAQTATGITGKVVDAKTQKPLQNVVATIQNTNLTKVTDATGQFTFSDIAVGTQLVQIKTQGYKEQLLQVDVIAGKVIDLGTVVLEYDVTEEQQLSLITITENDLGDDNSGSESTAGLLQASRDVFQQSAAFNWGQARFRIRGLDNEYGTTMINGVLMNKIYDGRPQWSNWGGLNDATRNQEFTMGSAPSDYTFGGILGTQEINTRASIYRPGTRISIAGTNTNYTGRLMGTTASGMRKDGWAYVVSASRRFADDGYFDGTTYSANSLFASVEKKLTERSSLNLTAIYAQNERGKNSPNTQEVTDLKDELYNSYWGYQNGRKRNSRVKRVEEPLVILSHYWKITDKTNLNTNVAYQFGEIGNSRLTYQGADNPDPTYYRNLPSFQTAFYDNNVLTPNYPAADALRNKFLNDGQLNWDNLIVANQASGDGHSFYTLYEDRTDDKLFTANTILSSQLSDNIVLNAGATYRNLKSHNFAEMIDLLGGSYFNDETLFGTGFDQRQSDLNNPGRQVGEGDTFSYNYNLNANNIDAFTQFKFTFNKFDFYVAQSYSRSEYQRDGLYRNGYYPSNSFGKSEKLVFDNFGFKGGLTYKISGRHFLNMNAAYMTKAPSLRNTFNNARINNNTVTGIQSETVSSADASYIISMPKLKARLTAFYSKLENTTETSFFFADGIGEDDSSSDGNLFVAETVTGLDKRNLGLEFGIEYPITSTIKLTATAAYGEYIYNNNPNVSYNVDDKATATNTNPRLDYGQAMMKNYKQSGMPQQAASFGIEYRSPKFWWVGANVNYLANSYIDIAPITRTRQFYDDIAVGVPVVNPSQETADYLLKQEQFDNFSLVNLTGGKSWRVKGNTIGFFASINNVLDETYKTGGFEQARNANYTQLSQDAASGTPQFGSKYFYGYGRTYFLNVYVSF